MLMLEKEMGVVQNLDMDQERREKGKENPNCDDLASEFDAVSNTFLVEKETGVVSAGIYEVSDGHSVTGEREEIEGDNEKIMGSHQQTSKLLRPSCVVLTSVQRPRLRWTLELHNSFVNAVMKLGGPNKATPKTVKEIMEVTGGVDGLALHHVKSHLQKFRLGKCNIKNWPDHVKKNLSANQGTSRYCSSSSLSRSHVQVRPKVIRPLRPKKPNEVQGSLYMRLEAELHLRRCQEAQRMYVDLALESERWRQLIEAQHLKTSSFPYYNITQKYQALPTMTPPPPRPPQPTMVAYGYPVLQQTDQQTVNPYDATMQEPQPSVYGSYPPYNTLEAVKAQLGATLQHPAAASSSQPGKDQTVAGGQAWSAIEEAQRRGDFGVVEAEVREETVDSVDSYIDWDRVEDEFPNVEFPPGFFDLFNFNWQL